MKKNWLATAWVALFLLMTACSLVEEAPLPTLVPTLQLSDAVEDVPTPLPETAVSPESTPPSNETEAVTSSVTPPSSTNIDSRGAIVYINSADEGLYLIRPDESEQTQYYALQNVEQLLPASFNGQRIAFIRDGRLSIARTDGSGIVEVTAVSNPSWLTWSPTRDEFAVIDTGDLVVIQADSAAAQRLTTGMQLASIPNSLAWSPDGSQLLFTCGAQATDLCYVARDGSGAVVNLTNNGADSFAWYREPTWSPDGSQISYVSPDEDKNLQIFIMNADGSDVQQLTFGSEQNSLHSWSPDGQRIAYANFADGLWRALAIGVDGNNLVELSLELPQMGAVVPKWGQDGLELSLLYTTDSSADAVAIAVVSLEETAVTPITENGWQMQWSADGGRLAYVSSGAQIYIQGISASGAGSPNIIDCPSGCKSFVWLP